MHIARDSPTHCLKELLGRIEQRARHSGRVQGCELECNLCQAMNTLARRCHTLPTELPVRVLPMGIVHGAHPRPPTEDCAAVLEGKTGVDAISHCLARATKAIVVICDQDITPQDPAIAGLLSGLWRRQQIARVYTTGTDEPILRSGVPAEAIVALSGHVFTAACAACGAVHGKRSLLLGVGACSTASDFGNGLSSAMGAPSSVSGPFAGFKRAKVPAWHLPGPVSPVDVSMPDPSPAAAKGSKMDGTSLPTLETDDVSILPSSLAPDAAVLAVDQESACAACGSSKIGVCRPADLSDPRWLAGRVGSGSERFRSLSRLDASNADLLLVLGSAMCLPELCQLCKHVHPLCPRVVLGPDGSGSRPMLLPERMSTVERATILASSDPAAALRDACGALWGFQFVPDDAECVRGSGSESPADSGELGRLQRGGYRDLWLRGDTVAAAVARLAKTSGAALFLEEPVLKVGAARGCGSAAIGPRFGDAGIARWRDGSAHELWGEGAAGEAEEQWSRVASETTAAGGGFGSGNGSWSGIQPGRRELRTMPSPSGTEFALPVDGALATAAFDALVLQTADAPLVGSRRAREAAAATQRPLAPDSLARSAYSDRAATVSSMLATPVTEEELGRAAASLARAGLDLEAQALADLGLS